MNSSIELVMNGNHTTRMFSYKSVLVLKINILLFVLVFSNQVSGEKMSSFTLYACSFEVFGRVQGVFFRKYTEKQAKFLGVRGWCMNTANNTVKGELEAPLAPFNEMREWLKTKGSPACVIEKVEFSPTRTISNFSYNDFSIRS